MSVTASDSALLTPGAAMRWLNSALNFMAKRPLQALGAMTIITLALLCSLFAGPLIGGLLFILIMQNVVAYFYDALHQRPMRPIRLMGSSIEDLRLLVLCLVIYSPLLLLIHAVVYFDGLQIKWAAALASVLGGIHLWLVAVPAIFLGSILVTHGGCALRLGFFVECAKRMVVRGRVAYSVLFLIFFLLAQAAMVLGVLLLIWAPLFLLFTFSMMASADDLFADTLNRKTPQEAGS